MNSKVDEYLENVGRWQKELEQLRKIVLDCGLNEEFKWMHPCYTSQGKNVVILQEFKNYCAIMFIKGALLADMDKVLVKITENVQSDRQIRFTNLNEVSDLKDTIKRYIFETIEIEKLGLKVEMKKTSDYEVPEELETKFQESPEYKTAFEKLTPGRQKGYLLHFAQAKQSKTRTTRIEQATNRILQGKGLRDCICGLSKRMPNCDGSHKALKKS